MLAEDSEISLGSWLKPIAIYWGKNLVFSVSRYFYVILVNISDKVRCQCQFHFLRNIDDN